MKIAVLSGKGGAGKTLVAVNLARVIANATYIDCDVEEPNGRLFLKPSEVTNHDVEISLPKWDSTRCNGCKKCVDFCKFNALIYGKRGLMVFDEVCHSCGGCALVCNEKAISWRQKTVGIIEASYHDDTRVISGILNMNEASGVPVIKAALQDGRDAENTVIDCPPGSACSVMESIKDADICVLVAEPTLFGVHNINMVYELANVFHKKACILLNKCIDGDNLARDFAMEHNIPIVGAINWDKRLGELSSNGVVAVEEYPEFRALMESIKAKIWEVAE